ncbi:hypothetical protein ACQJBY_013313 [Aegilops geniculata]
MQIPTLETLRIGQRGHSPSPSPRTTSCDIIELRPSPHSDWDAAPTSPTASAQSPRAPSPCSEPEPITPVFVPAVGNVVAPPCSPLFVVCPPPLLAAPRSPSPRPRPPTKRRNTLAGVVGFDLGRRSPRLRAKNRSMPVAKLAERLLCLRMGIVGDGEEVTEEAIGRFVAMFKGQLSDLAIAGLRALFKLDCDLAMAVEDALLQHGGEGGSEMPTLTSEDAAV